MSSRENRPEVGNLGMSERRLKRSRKAESDSEDEGEDACDAKTDVGGSTWKLLINGQLLHPKRLRKRLLAMWTLVGVLAGLVATLSVDGITNSASSFADYAQAFGNQTCVYGTCISVSSLYKWHGFCVSAACILSFLALVMSLLFYSYLLIQPTSKTGQFASQFLWIFPLDFIFVLVALTFMIVAICIQAWAAFGDVIAAIVSASTGGAFLFCSFLFYCLDTRARKTLKDYQKTKAADELTASGVCAQENAALY